ncbi:hypothetical protein B6U93_04295 [Candidatus Woesearchaeota archaeon ex4484_78]|nr:MAG: hypothetical protein B6U93_04295 [Candidatus Woesearchaeota archaeon ex4484_78]
MIIVTGKPEVYSMLRKITSEKPKISVLESTVKELSDITADLNTGRVQSSVYKGKYQLIDKVTETLMLRVEHSKIIAGKIEEYKKNHDKRVIEEIVKYCIEQGITTLINNNKDGLIVYGLPMSGEKIDGFYYGFLNK